MGQGVADHVRSLCGCNCLRQFEGGNGRQRTSRNGLQFAVHAGRAVDDLADLLFLPRPLGLELALLPLYPGEQIGETLDDRLDAVLEFDAGQIAVEDLHLLVLARLVGALGIDLDEAVAQ